MVVVVGGVVVVLVVVLGVVGGGVSLTTDSCKVIDKSFLICSSFFLSSAPLSLPQRDLPRRVPLPQISPRFNFHSHFFRR